MSSGRAAGFEASGRRQGRPVWQRSFHLIDRRLNGLLILNGANRTDTTPSWQKYRSLGILRSFLQNQLSVVRFSIVVAAYILVRELWVQ